jgi:hypothetical protein
MQHSLAKTTLLELKSKILQSIYFSAATLYKLYNSNYMKKIFSSFQNKILYSLHLAAPPALNRFALT